MKILVTLLFVVTCQSAMGQELRAILLQLLHTTHHHEAWFVPANKAIEGLTAEQASWRDGNGNHSVGQLTYHLVFWNKGNLDHMQGKPTTAPKSNEDTFDSFDKKQWEELVKQLDQVMSDLEKFVLEADEAKLKEIAPMITNISTHNAYHIGQIIVVRKAQKAWNPKKDDK